MPESNQEQDPQADSDRQVDSDRRFPLWTILPWTLLAAALLLLLPRVFHSSHTVTPPAAVTGQSSPLFLPQPAVSQTPSAAASAGRTTETPLLAAPVPASAAPMPLTVTLYSANGSKPIPVGKPVMISAYASLPPGQSATLAISYEKGNEPRTLLSLAQGSLSSAAWTPIAPGRYKFTASALDGRKNGAFSHGLIISVDAQPAPPHPTPAPVAAAPAASPAPMRVASRPSINRPTAPAITAPKPSRPKLAASKPLRKALVPPHASPYHVAAASFRVGAVAETLAGALRQRGFNAFVRPVSKGQGSKMYQVETGDYVRLDEAQAQMSLLKRDGYPAFLFRSR